MESNTKTKSVMPVITPGEDERGSIIVIFALIIVATVLMVALVVDHSREAFAINHLQRSADIAALTTVRRFNGTLAGWQDAKKAAVLSLKQNPIQGASMSELQNLVLDAGETAGSIGSAPHVGTSGRAGGVTVTVERGIHWFDPNVDGDPLTPGVEGGFRFISLENRSTYLGLRTYLIANAVRVRVTLDRLFTTAFGQFAGTESLDNMSRDSIAVVDSNFAVPVLPIAIPACQLMMNTSNADIQNGKYTTDSYTPDEICRRPGLATEANPMGDLATWPATPNGSGGQQWRLEGLTRFLSFVGFDYINYNGPIAPCGPGAFAGPGQACTYPLMTATLGVVSKTPGKVASAREVADAFGNGGTLTASLGNYFAPLHSIQNFTPSDIAKIAGRIKNEGTLKFREVFTTPHPTLGWKAKRNFPGMRRMRNAVGEDQENIPEGFVYSNGAPDLTANVQLLWPSQNPTVKQKMLMDHQDSPLAGPSDTRTTDANRPNFTNPMCHEPLLNESIDNLDAPVLKGLAMVIVSENDDVSFCAHKELWLHQAQHAYPPVAALNPKIAGFLPIYSWDLGLHDLNGEPGGPAPGGYNVDYGSLGNIFVPTSATPSYTNPLTGYSTVDRNPGGLSLTQTEAVEPIRNEVEEKTEERDSWIHCSTRDACADKPSRPRFNVPAEILQCWDLRHIISEVENVFTELDNEVNPVCLPVCDDDDDDDDDPPCGDSCSISDAQVDKQTRLFNTLKALFEGMVNALPLTHCLPQKIQGCTDFKNECYVSPPYTLPAGPGCGGIMYAVDCEGGPSSSNNLLWTSGDYWEKARPALVADDDKNSRHMMDN